jgi:putative membrane-bound dehydrogenase-like protein
MFFIPLGAIWYSNAADPPQTGPATEKRFPPLKVPPGFKATLFACDPLIEYPSVIAAGPKPGALFVAIDYMTGLGTDGKVKSEIRLIEDTDGDGYADKATVVAKDFNSIQGLAFHDGTLFVMHAPFLTAVRIALTPGPSPKGRGEERKDLLNGLGLKPEDNPTRLHCANGVVVGHDGWLYLALGDNGVNVLRPEGDRLIHHGGGILRCRPDGRNLHLFSTGLRNIYDIALDAELNVFTRDNENDGGTYMVRVCHSFFGADHGYPYHYEDRKGEAMPPIGDFGLGSSAGGVCYLEQQFPPAYRGNLFFCEWGKSVVRYELKRSGSGFAPVKEIEFATGDSKDTYPFKPTDIVIQPDGTMMVSDYADGQRPKRGRGRIYHIAYVGRDSDPVKKATGSESYPTKLDSESYHERCEAQAAIERAGKKPSFQDLGPRGRLHTIWALAKIEGPRAIDELMQIAKSDSEPSVRAQAIRAIADLADPILVKHRLDAGPGDAKLAEQIARLSEGQDSRVVLEAVIALGRLRWAHAPAWMRRTLANPDATLSHAWMQTLRRSQAWHEVMKSLDDGDTPQRRITLCALAEQYAPLIVDGLIERLKEEHNGVHRREYADLLARVYKKPGPWKYWGYRPGPKPANTEAWERTAEIEKALDDVLTHPDRDSRIAALKHLQREKVPVSVATLEKMLDGENQREREATIIASLGEHSGERARTLLYSVVTCKGDVANRLKALDLYLKRSGPRLRDDLLDIAVDTSDDGTVIGAEALRRLGDHPQGVPAKLGHLVLRWMNASSAEIRAAAIGTVRDLRSAGMEKALLDSLGDRDVRVRRAAAAVVGKLQVKGAIDPLLKLATEADLGVRLACLDSLRRLREPRVVPLALNGLKERDLELTALACLRELGGPEHAPAIADFARRGPSTDGTFGAIRALANFRDHQGISEPQRNDLNRSIAEIHGATGMLVDWSVSVATRPGERAEIVKSMVIAGKKPASWRTLLAMGAEGRMTLAPAKNAPWFALTDIVVPAATSVEFLASSDGALEVWRNGTSIHQRTSPGKFRLDSDRFAATLDKGTNRILLETGSSDAAVEFHLHFRRKSAKAEHEKLTQAALSRAGNAERGRTIFLDKESSQCLKCHRLGTQGERIGPELTGVGARFSRIYLIESILEPSRAIAPSFETLVVTLKNGKTVNGIKIAESVKTLVLADNQGQKHELSTADIEERHASPVSTMPEGLEQRLSADEFVDLIAFLASQKERTAK